MAKRVWDDYVSERDRKVYALGGFAKRGHFGVLVRLKGWPLNVPLNGS